MTAPLAIAALVRPLLADLDALLPAIDTAAPQDPAAGASAAIIARYHAVLTDAARTDDAASALRGANLAAGINRGLADAVWAGRHPPIAVLARQASNLALSVATTLRARCGMDC